MIVAVKTNTKKRLIVKALALASVVGMFVIYYFYMSNEFANQQKENEQQNVQAVKKDEKKEKKKKLERIIYREIETAVDLIGQRNIQKVKVVSNRALIVVDPETNLDALAVRYGSMALIKKGIKDTKIAIDLKYILESKYDEN